MNLTAEQVAEALRIALGTARKYAARLPNADGHAEDAAQDAVAEVLREAHRWTPDRGAWGAWVGTITARVVRRSLRVSRAPVTGNQWRAHVWAVSLRAVPDDTLASAPAQVADAVGEVFAHEVRLALLDACAHVPHAELGLAALLEQDTTKRLALRAGVAKLTVERAARAVREALEDSADLGAFWMETPMTTKTDPQVTRMHAQGFMPATEAAERAGYDISHIYRLIKGDAPKVEGFRIGERAWYVKRASLVAYLGEQGAKALGLDQPLPGEAPEAPAAPEVDPDDLVPATEPA